MNRWGKLMIEKESKIRKLKKVCASASCQRRTVRAQTIQDVSKDARKVHYVSYLDLCHLKHVELSKEMQETGDFETHNAKNDEEQRTTRGLHKSTSTCFSDKSGHIPQHHRVINRDGRTDQRRRVSIYTNIKELYVPSSSHSGKWKVFPYDIRSPSARLSRSFDSIQDQLCLSNDILIEEPKENLERTVMGNILLTNIRVLRQKKNVRSQHHVVM